MVSVSVMSRCVASGRSLSVRVNPIQCWNHYVPCEIPFKYVHTYCYMIQCVCVYVFVYSQATESHWVNCLNIIFYINMIFIFHSYLLYSGILIKIKYCRIIYIFEYNMPAHTTPYYYSTYLYIQISVRTLQVH